MSMSFFHTLASATQPTHADSGILKLSTDLLPEISTVAAATQCKLLLETKPFERYISNSTRLCQLDETQYNRSDRRRKGFLQSIKFIFQKLSILQKLPENVQATFKILYESLCILPSSFLSRRTIAQRISGIEHRVAPSEKTISRAIKVLNRLDIIRVTRKRFRENGRVWDNNFFRLPNWLKTPSMTLLFNAALAASFGVCVPEDIICSYKLNNLTTIDSVSRVREKKSFFQKTEELNHAPSDRHGLNARTMFNRLPVSKRRNKKIWYRVTDTISVSYNSSDPALQLTKLNLHEIFESCVADNVISYAYPIRKDSPAVKGREVKREIVNPGPDGSIFQIIEFICCQIPMTERSFKKLLEIPDELLRIAVDPWRSAADYSAFEFVTKTAGLYRGIHSSKDELLYERRLHEYGINPASFLQYGAIGAFQAKKKGKYVQESSFRR